MDWFKPELKTKNEKDPIKEIVAKYIKEKDRIAAKNHPDYSKLKVKVGRKRARQSQTQLGTLFAKAIYKVDEVVRRGHSKDKALDYTERTLGLNENKMRILVELMNQNLDFFQQRGMWR